jgi:signal transduction histidine kinase
MPEAKATILYIEDDVTSARLMERILTTQGYRFRHAINGLEGLRIADEETPDLILTDINLPDIDGLAITTRLRHLAAVQDKPIVAITSYSPEDGRQMALACGCDGYITKPISTKNISAQIDRFLNGHQEKLSEAEERTFLKAHTADLVQKLEGRVRELGEANQQLQEANRQLQEIDRQRAHFFNVVSHELRTPFTPIRGYIDLLASGAMGPLAPKQQQALDIIRVNLKNALRLLDDLLDLSKLKSTGISLSMELFSAQELLDEIAKTGKSYVENSVVSFETAIAPDLPWMYGDKGRLRQVILNLLNNAVKFTDEGSITLIAKVAKNELIIQVKDTGSGLLPEEIPHVFNEFWQSKDIHGTGIGTGLGLAICKYLIEAHHGKIWLESEKDVGTTVSVVIPVSTSIQSSVISHQLD